MGEIYSPEARISGRGVRSIATATVERIDVVGKRRSFIVSNCEASGGRILYIAGADRVEAAAVFPQTSQPLIADAEFYLVNRTGSGGAITYVVGEILAVERATTAAPKAAAASGGGGGGGNPYGGPGFGGGGGGLSFPP